MKKYRNTWGGLPPIEADSGEIHANRLFTTEGGGDLGVLVLGIGENETSTLGKKRGRGTPGAGGTIQRSSA